MIVVTLNSLIIKYFLVHDIYGGEGVEPRPPLLPGDDVLQPGDGEDVPGLRPAVRLLVEQPPHEAPLLLQ